MPDWKVVTHWSTICPILAWIVFALHEVMPWIAAIALIAAVISSVHHAEVVAHRVGEPYGTLVLALAITTIEVGLIITLMLAGGEETHALARDTVFAAVMILLTGIIGLCMLIGGARYHEQIFRKQGVSASLIALTAILVLTLILPNYTTTIPGPYYNSAQLIFVALVSLVLYGSFVLVQAVRHRDYFLPEDAEVDKDKHADPPSVGRSWFSGVFLVVTLTVVVILAKSLAPQIEYGVRAVGAPKSLVGIIVAMVILLPEGMAAIRAARKDRLQTSFNLALGSALASIGLTIPAVAVISLITGMTITLGIDLKSTLLLILALFTIMLSVGSGRTNILQGIVLLVVFAVYVFITIVP